MNNSSSNSLIQDTLLFEILGFKNISDRVSNSQEMRKQYMQQMLRHHPDEAARYSAYLDYSTEKATKTSQMIDEAYRVLSDQGLALSYVVEGRNGIEECHIDWEGAERVLNQITDLDNFDASEEDESTPYGREDEAMVAEKKRRKSYIRPLIANFKDSKISKVVNHRAWGQMLRFSVEIGQIKTWLSCEEMMHHHHHEFQGYIRSLPRRRAANLINKDLRLVCHI